jgi:manganese transport protein
MAVLGAVVMPHNLFLHSEIIQSRKWNLEDRKIKNRQLKYEFADTSFAMILGWAINSAMIIVAAAVFYSHGTHVTDLSQAHETLKPLLGNSAAVVFAFALICAGVASSVTVALAGGSIFAGIFQEPFNIKDTHSRAGILITLVGALIIIPFLRNPFQGLIWSQIILSMQLPFTIFTLLYLTSSRKVMGVYANTLFGNIVNWTVAGVVVVLNVMLLFNILSG